MVLRSRSLERLLGSLIVVLATAGLATAGESLVDETSNFADVEQHVERYVEEFGAERVLLVVDIDNTLLAMNAALGSDQWFEWQNYLLEHQPESPQLVAKDFDSLLAVQDTLFALGKMHPPQAGQPAIVARIQEMGVQSVVLTSRGPEFRSYTERELARNGYRLATTAMKVKGVPRHSFKPYNLEAISRSGLTAAEAKLFRLRRPREASYLNGIFMTSGQHKGAMLLILLQKARQPVDAVVFVDDHGRHVTRVYDALVRRGVTVTSVHYKREDANVNRFKYGDKHRVTDQWRRLDKTVRAVFD